MTDPPRDPLARTERLLIDGSNLAHGLRRGGASLPAPTLIGRLRAVVPATIAVELVFDGGPDPGMRGERVAPGVTVRYGGRRSADELLLDIVDEARARLGPIALAGVLVVTDDRALRLAVRERGARTAGTAWLIGRLERAGRTAPSIGNRRPPRRAPGSGRMRP